MKTVAAALLLLLAPVGVRTAPRGAAGLTVDHAWARPTMGAMGMSALYLDIHGGAAPDRLVSASTPAGRLQLHRTTTGGGMTGMVAAPGLDVPAHGDVRLAPGGFHLMLTDALHPLTVGERIAVTLRFARAGAVTLEAPVRATAPR